MLVEGSMAPDFELPDQTGKTNFLSSKRGKWVVLYFYPKDMTSGCTTEACNFQEVLPDFSNLNAEIIGVSKDSPKSHTKFAEKYQLKFTLLSDENGSVCQLFGVWQKKKLYGREYMGIVRSTFIIDPDGKIVKIFQNVKVQNHHLEVIELLKKLQ